MGGLAENNTLTTNDNRSLDRALLTAAMATNSSTATRRFLPESGRALTSIERRERLIAILDEALAVINVPTAPTSRMFHAPTTHASPLPRD
ncbi:hypothetical protein FisN_4Hu322 [Fistulifera solaris]|uniref:Uncharacterized protein n=1 Tax=Fistulifera solaris TaxID=1519565 RepID=A0A1Z5KEL9_FISSO|nr:hypothetical protein FisN_4Hu322 [Fistulifera solaris]|eukprot:GAX24764.1 hypothetical protein FisN_4Hu322 [Fistulifera solaris]